MENKIVLCCDGTWNLPRSKTNVHRMRDSLVDIPPTQTVRYLPGVGTAGAVLDRLWAGITGGGLEKNVLAGYTMIAAELKSGKEEVFLFGFSRGAYTARSIAGMIAYCGLPLTSDATERDTLARKAFRAFQDRKNDARSSGELMSKQPWTGKPHQMVDGNIIMIGVWDTVGARGIPGALFKERNRKKYEFLNTTLDPSVAGYHALALDERRKPFEPALWDSASGGQTMEQVWFAGAHSDVGGKRKASDLAKVTFAWMLRRAKCHGLDVMDQASDEYLKTPIDPAWPLSKATRWDWRWIRPTNRRIAEGSSISETACTRIAELPKYTPPLQISLGPPRGLDAAKYAIGAVLECPRSHDGRARRCMDCPAAASFRGLGGAGAVTAPSS